MILCLGDISPYIAVISRSWQEVKQNMKHPVAMLLTLALLSFIMVPTVTKLAAKPHPHGQTRTAVFAGGCFWCIQAQFQRLKGVLGARSGYTGGHTLNPTYSEVSKGITGHYQVVEVEYEPAVISYDNLLDVFFFIHDPTQTDGQGADKGSHYMSAVFYQNHEERQKTQQKLEELMKDGYKVVTKVLPLKIFYQAEKNHQDYWDTYGAFNPYCSIIPGKIQKMTQKFRDLIAQ